MQDVGRSFYRCFDAVFVKVDRIAPSVVSRYRAADHKSECFTVMPIFYTLKACF